MCPAPQTCLALGYGAIRALCNGAVVLLVAAVLTITRPALAEPVTVAALGDSLTAGYGLPPEQGLVPQLQTWLDAHGADVRLQNAGVSGDTTSGGLARLDWTLTPEVDALIVTLGGNDLLRGLDPAESRANLDAILHGAQARALPVLLVGLPAPPNFGPDYQTTFNAIYPELATRYRTLLVPDFFAPLTAEGPAALTRLLQADGLHPNAEGVARIVESLGPEVLALLALVPR
ncbi:MAG: arylesterase [Pseudorhodobacter sp.]|nr:arylesterase [Pseudorhodobacter sp.]